MGETKLTSAPCANASGVGSPMEPNAMTPKPQAAISIPTPILRGAEGSFPFLAKKPNIANETGVKATTKNGLNCWKICGRISTVLSWFAYCTPNVATAAKATKPETNLPRPVLLWNTENMEYTKAISSTRLNTLNVMPSKPEADACV